MAVVIEIGKAAAPSPVTLTKARLIRCILKITVALIAIEAVTTQTPAAFGHSVGVINTGHEEIEVTVVVIITNCCSHAVFIRYYRSSGINKAPVSLIMEYCGCEEIGCQQYVEQSVIIYIRKVGSEGPILFCKIRSDSGFFGYIRKCAVAVISP